MNNSIERHVVGLTSALASYYRQFYYNHVEMKSRLPIFWFEASADNFDWTVCKLLIEASVAASATTLEVKCLLCRLIPP
jgi:hypothetical protein